MSVSVYTTKDRNYLSICPAIYFYLSIYLQTETTIKRIFYTIYVNFYHCNAKATVLKTFSSLIFLFIVLFFWKPSFYETTFSDIVFVYPKNKKNNNNNNNNTFIRLLKSLFQRDHLLLMFYIYFQCQMKYKNKIYGIY